MTLSKLDLCHIYSLSKIIWSVIMRGRIGLTKYMARKWLDQLSTQISPYLVGQKVGQTVTYRRRC